MERVLSYVIEQSWQGKDIKIYLLKKVNISSVLLKKLKTYDDGITVNGVHQNVNYVLSKGDELKIVLREGSSEGIVPKEQNFEIVYEDEDIMIVNKPHGLPTHPSIGNYENTLANGLMYYFMQKGEDRVFRAVNRLDRDTSGLMCIAKNSYAHHILSKQIQEGTLKREYLALVMGDLSEEGTLNAPIARSKEGIIKREVSKSGQTAITHYKSIHRFGKTTLIGLHLETGRTHQIRVHMAHLGYPLVGDWLYGEEIEQIGRYLLHSAYIELIHPVTGERLRFSDNKFEYMEKVAHIIDKIY